MDKQLIFSPYVSPLAASSKATVESPHDLIFVQNLGLVPKHIVTASQPAKRPAAERKWLGADFSHVIVSQ